MTLNGAVHGRVRRAGQAIPSLAAVASAACFLHRKGLTNARSTRSPIRPSVGPTSGTISPQRSGRLFAGVIYGVTTVIKKLFLWVGGVVTLLLIFCVVDLPQTVRLKAAIVRMLPLDPESMDSAIRNLCAGSHSGFAVTDCYLAFRSEEAVNAIADDQARKRKCQQIAQRIESGEEKSWQRQEPRSREEIMELLKPLMEEGEPDPKLVRGASGPRFAALFLCWR
jgi:hypothetical protein